jgi:hypothetical protein
MSTLVNTHINFANAAMSADAARGVDAPVGTWLREASFALAGRRLR